MYIIDTEKDSNLIIELTQNDNNTGSLEFQIVRNGKPISLIGKNVKFAFVKTSVNKGDILSEVKVTNPTEGKISVKITSALTRFKGLFVCGLGVYGSDGYMEHTGNFRMNFKRDIFENTAENIISGSAYSELMHILKTAQHTIGNIDKTLQSKLTKFEEDKNNFIKKAEQEKKDTLNKITTDAKNQVNNFISETRTTINEINTSGKKAIKDFNEESEKALNKVNNEIKASVSSFERQKAESIEDFKTRTKKQLEAQKEENKNFINSTKGQFDNLIAEGQRDLSKIKQTKEEIEGLKTNVDETVAEYEQKINNSIDNFNSTKVETLKNFKSEKDKVITEFKAEGKTEADNRKKEWDSLKKIAIEENNAVELQSQINTLDKALKSNQSLEYKGENITCNDTLASRTENLQILGNTKYKRKDESLTDVWEEGVSLESTGEKEKNLIEIKSCGKNLLNQSDKLSSGILNDRGQEVPDETSSYYKSFISVKPSTTYSYSGDGTQRIYYFDINKRFISRTTEFFSSPGTFKTPEQCYFIKAQIHKPRLKNNIQLEENSTPTPYEPYQGDTKQIQLPHPLRKVGDVADRIYEKDGRVWLEQNVGVVVLDGSEEWEKYYKEQNENFLKIQFQNPKFKIKNNIVTADTLPFEKDQRGLSWITKECISAGGGWIIIILKQTNIQDFKKWLSENPTTVLYQLETPIVTELNTKNIDLDTFSPITHITSDNNIQPILNFKVPSNLASIVQSNSRAINEIYDLIDTLITPQLIQNRLDIDINKI